jgi:hypothetical protein
MLRLEHEGADISNIIEQRGARLRKLAYLVSVEGLPISDAVMSVCLVDNKI